MNLLDRHIFTSVLFTCAAAVGLFAFVVLLPNIVRELLGPLLAGQFGFDTFARLVGLLLPFAVSYALPMGVLTGVLLTLGRMSADSEITAMRSAGISVARLARPVFVLGAVCATAAFYVNFESMPWARQQYYREFAAAVRANPLRIIVPKTFIRDFSGTVLYVGEREGPILRDIWIWELDDQQRVKRLVRAEAGRLDYDEPTNSLIPTLVRARVEERNQENPEDFTKSPKAASVDRAEGVRISLDRYFGRNLERMKDDWLTYPALRERQAKLDATTPAPDKAVEHARDKMKLSLILHDRLTLAFAVFSFALIGVPLGIKVSRRETSANLGIALGLVLTFYFLTVAIKWLDRRPELRPDLLLWLPNVLFIGLAVWLFTRIDRK
ncbi:MAG: LptF/LptG family permease [Opitutaceae bacterium]|nr:LptF/LptG family permease [Opitutaceae bacterium]